MPLRSGPLPVLIDDPPQHCPTCNETTPHSRRRFPLLPVLAGLLAALTLAAVSQGGPALVLAALFAVGSLVCLAHERKRFWSTHCERCRFKKRAQPPRSASTAAVVKHCPACDTTTPHSHRLIAFPLIGAILLAALAVFAALQGGEFLVVGALLAYAALFLFLRDREQFWSTHCERCRTKKRAQLKSEKPRLDGNTEIQIL